MVSGHEQQVEYHKELERNFYKFTERLAPLMGNSNTKQAIISLRESYFNGFSKPSTLSHSNTLESNSNGSNSKLTNGLASNGTNGQYSKYK